MMKRVPVVWIAAALLLVAAGLGLWAYLSRPQPTDRELITRLVADAQTAVERHNSTGLTRLISRDYTDRNGVNRQQLVGMIVQWMRSGEDYLVVPEIAELRQQGDFAEMRLRVRVGVGDKLLNEGEAYGMLVRLRKEGRQWKVISAEGYGEPQSDVMGE